MIHVFQSYSIVTSSLFCELGNYVCYLICLVCKQVKSILQSIIIYLVDVFAKLWYYRYCFFYLFLCLAECCNVVCISCCQKAHKWNVFNHRFETVWPSLVRSKEMNLADICPRGFESHCCRVFACWVLCLVRLLSCIHNASNNWNDSMRYRLILMQKQ